MTTRQASEITRAKAALEDVALPWGAHLKSHDGDVCAECITGAVATTRALAELDEVQARRGSRLRRILRRF